MQPRGAAAYFRSDGNGLAFLESAGGSMGIVGADGGGAGPERASQGVMVNGAVRSGAPGTMTAPADSQV